MHYIRLSIEADNEQLECYSKRFKYYYECNWMDTNAQGLVYYVIRNS